MRITGILIQYILIGLVSVGYTSASASNVVVGKKLPAVEIVDKGECVIRQADIDYVPWHSKTLQGQVHIVEYVAARAGVDKINAAFFAAVKEANIPMEQLTIFKMVNSDDALWGTSGLVAGEIEKTKRKEPDTRFVIDAQGLGLEAWGLQEKSAAIAVLDAQGQVLFFKEGGLSEAEVAQSLKLIRQQLEASVSIVE